MDAEMAKTMQRILQKQGMKFKLNTKVMGGDVESDNIKINVESSKGGKSETVRLIPVLIGLGLPELIPVDYRLMPTSSLSQLAVGHTPPAWA